MKRPPRVRNVGLVRVLSLLRLLEGRGRWTLYDLADRFTVCPRTVRRDLAALDAAGYAIAHESDGGPAKARDRGVWWLA